MFCLLLFGCIGIQSSRANKLYFDNYTVNEGLPNNYIDCIFQDHKGWVWLGTHMGVASFDGLKFKSYPLFLNDTTTKEGLLVRHFYEDIDNRLYVCFEEYGVAEYNRQLDRFESMKMNHQLFEKVNTAKDLVKDKQGVFWIATKQGVVRYSETNKEMEHFKASSENRKILSDDYIRVLALDKYENLWIGSRSGLDYLDTKSREVIHFAEYFSALGDDILEILIDDKGNKWIGTSESGIVLIDSTNAKFKQIIPDRYNSRSYKINELSRLKNGELWIGTRGGIYIFNEAERIKQHIENNELETNALVHNSILSILEDNKGDVWVGTRGGMSHLSLQKQTFKSFIAIPDNSNYLNNREIYNIWVDELNNSVWLGTEKGGINILNRENNTFQYITANNQTGLSNNCIKSIVSVNNHEVYIGTFGGGLNIYNQNTGKFKVFKHASGDPFSISSNIIWHIAQDDSGNIWLGTAEGLDRFDPKTGKFKRYHEFNDIFAISWIQPDNNNDLWLGSQKITIFRPGTGTIKEFNIKARGMYQDRKNRIWITTEDMGLVLVGKEKGIIKIYSEAEGLASKQTYCIEEDKQGRLWISTAKGLTCFDPETEKFKNYSTNDGLLNNQYYYGASAKAKNGELFFGGINGLTAFNPENVQVNEYIPPVYITNLRIFNQTVNIQSGEKPILTKAISETKEIKIPYHLNVISFEFAALNYTNSIENKYKYKLTGFDNNWNNTNENRSATYTNLNPGEYYFEVIASNNNDIWNKEGAGIRLIVLPPWYKTTWFKLLALLIFAISMLLIFRFLLHRSELKKKLEFEKERARNLHELDTFKLKFFTNLSHEIKTPLTLIISPLKKLLQQKNMPTDAVHSLHLMERNAQSLFKLVTELLDYRKIQEGQLKIELKRGDIIAFCKGVFESYADIMNDKEISHRFATEHPELLTDFDAEKLKHILNNLFSNAIKYNQPGGSIVFLVKITTNKNSKGSDNNRYIQLVVEDSGIGIPKEEQSKIFNRFYRNKQSTNITGSGIGLSFVKELIQLYNGEIHLDSTPGKGTKIQVLLPLLNIEALSSVENGFVHGEFKEYVKSKEFETANLNKDILLVIDDNKDILSFINNHFSEKFMVLLAENGKTGFEMATEAIPDIIISDIMLPDTDGRKLCKEIKNDERCAHIPVILLSALSSDGSMLKGLDYGADDYIAKPFDVSLLERKIENFLISRERLKEKYSREINLSPTNHSIDSPDEKFLKKALDYIESNIDNPNLKIEDFAKDMNMSRMQLYRKMTALTKMSVKECIVDIRLKRAAQILEQQKINISEVAYAVGFNDLSYFGKCFKSKFRLNPSDYIKKFGKSE